METNLALTIIGSVLILVGIIFNAVPKLVNEKIMGQLPKEAVGISALFRVVLGGLAIAIGTIALYLSASTCRTCWTLIILNGVRFRGCDCYNNIRKIKRI